MRAMILAFCLLVVGCADNFKAAKPSPLHPLVGAKVYQGCSMEWCRRDRHRSRPRVHMHRAFGSHVGPQHPAPRIVVRNGGLYEIKD